MCLQLDSQLENTWSACSPTQDDVVVKEVHLDMLESDGLVEALRDKQSEESSEVWRVEEGDTHALWKPLQQWEQHAARVLPPCVRAAEDTAAASPPGKTDVLTARQTNSLGASLYLGHGVRSHIKKCCF